MVSKKSSKDRSYELKKLKAECVAEENNRYNISQAKRKSGSGEVPAGNTGLKATKSEVFILLVGPEDTTKPIQEQFKSTRSYKKTKAFVDAASAKNFLDVSKFPNNSIIILILVTPDFTKEDAEMAMKTGKIKVYSSKPIEQGGFISPSRMMAQDYAGSGKVYESEVNINDVAWINSDEGQFAKVEKSETESDPERAEIIESGKEDWIITKEDAEVWNSLSDDDKYFLSMSGDMGFWFDTIMDNEDGLEHYNELKAKFSVGKEKPKSKLPF